MKIIKDPNFRILHETNELVVGHVFEYAYLFNKKNHKEVYMGGFYGDPTCGLIGENNDWCVVCGDTLNIWDSKRGLLSLDDVNIKWGLKIRQQSRNVVELLIDPWSDKGSIWSINIKTLEKYKIRDYKMINEVYSEDLDW